MIEKKCPACKEVKPLSDFHKNKKKRDGVASQCKACKNEERKRKWSLLSDEERRSIQEAWPSHQKMRANRKRRVRLTDEQKRERERQYRIKNKDRLNLKYRLDPAYRERVLKASREAYYRRRDYYIAKKHRRKAMIKSVSVGHISSADVRAILNEREECPYCGIKLTEGNINLDHMEPVSKGGLHVKSNLIASCFSCNMRKRDKPFLVWMNELQYPFNQAAMDAYISKKGVHPEQIAAEMERQKVLPARF